MLAILNRPFWKKSLKHFFCFKLKVATLVLRSFHGRLRWHKRRATKKVWSFCGHSVVAFLHKTTFVVFWSFFGRFGQKRRLLDLLRPAATSRWVSAWIGDRPSMACTWKRWAGGCFSKTVAFVNEINVFGASFFRFLTKQRSNERSN